MGLDQQKAFLKHNSTLIPSDENIMGVVIAEPKGGAWRRGMRAAGVLTGAVAEIGNSNDAQEMASEVAAWPEAPASWIVLTDKQVHVFGGSMGSTKVGPDSAHYPLDRVAELRFDKKLLISSLNVSFKDGSSAELGVAKQKVKPFVEAIERRFGTG